MADHTPITPLATASFHQEGRWLTVVLQGELDLASSPGIVSAVDAAIAPGFDRVRIDLRQVTFCDSSGLAMLFRLRQQSVDQGFDFALEHPTEPVRRILAMCDASGVLRIVDDLTITAAAE